MIKGEPLVILQRLLQRYPKLNACRDDIERAYEIMVECFAAGGKLLLCGNGGSGADSGHIAGELLKAFLKTRPLSAELSEAIDEQTGTPFAARLQCGLPAISLCDQGAIVSAISNDLGGDLIYAQQVVAYAKPGDVLLGISTSGNSENVRKAMMTAKAMGMATIELTGQNQGRIGSKCDISICVPAVSTPDIQEYHLPVYHALCAMLEANFFAL